MGIKYFGISLVILIIYIISCVYIGEKSRVDGVNIKANKILAKIALTMFFISLVSVNYISEREEREAMDLKNEIEQENIEKNEKNIKERSFNNSNLIREYYSKILNAELLEGKEPFYDRKLEIINEIEKKGIIYRRLYINLIANTWGRVSRVHSRTMRDRRIYYGSLNLFIKVYLVFFLFYILATDRREELKQDIFYSGNEL